MSNNNSLSNINLTPDREVFIAAALAALGSYAMKYGSPGMEAVEHLVATIIGRNLAGSFAATDDLEMSLVKESDYYTAGIRAAVSMAQKKGQSNIMWSAFAGIAANSVARYVNTKVLSSV